MMNRPKHYEILGVQSEFNKIERAMDYLNREHLPYEKQDVGDRQARFVLMAAIERLGQPCGCSSCSKGIR